MKQLIAPRPIRLRHARHYIAVAAQAQAQFLAEGDGTGSGLVLFDQQWLNPYMARRLTCDPKTGSYATSVQLSGAMKHTLP